jgi:hypothetical protein
VRDSGDGVLDDIEQRETVRLGVTRLVLQLGLDAHRARNVDNRANVNWRAARSRRRHELDHHIGNILIASTIDLLRRHRDLHAVSVRGRRRRGNIAK